MKYYVRAFVSLPFPIQSGGVMEKRFRIYVSTPDPESHLSERQEKFFRAIIKKVEGAGFLPQGFYEDGDSGDFDANSNGMRDLMRLCQGVLIFAFAQWQVLERRGKEQPAETDNEQVRKSKLFSVNDFNHFEGGLAIAESKPILVITEGGVSKDGIMSKNVSSKVITIPRNATLDWLEGETFTKAFNLWRTKVNKHRHIFLGYSSNALDTAQKIQLFFNMNLNLRVLDWRTHFQKGESILQQIDEAARLCTCGIFLFTKDDVLETDDKNPGRGSTVAAPRDNVIFEAGYFVRARGKKRALIILEKGAKLPVDLGGDIYVHLEDRNRIEAIESGIRDYLEEVL
jgi:hypothetical protein